MTPSKIIVVLVSGKAGVGKTTLSELMRENFNNRGLRATIIPIASSLKYTAKTVGWDGKKDEKGRRLLQELGGVVRNYDKDIWVRESYRSVGYNVGSLDVVITDDWRFPNEKDFLEKESMYQVFKLRVVAPHREILKGTPAYNDVSETSLPDGFTPESEDYYDLEIGNYGNMDEFIITADHVVEYIISNAQMWHFTDKDKEIDKA